MNPAHCPPVAQQEELHQRIDGLTMALGAAQLEIGRSEQRRREESLRSREALQVAQIGHAELRCALDVAQREIGVFTDALATMTGVKGSIEAEHADLLAKHLGHVAAHERHFADHHRHVASLDDELRHEREERARLTESVAAERAADRVQLQELQASSAADRVELARLEDRQHELERRWSTAIGLVEGRLRRVVRRAAFYRQVIGALRRVEARATRLGEDVRLLTAERITSDAAMAGLTAALERQRLEAGRTADERNRAVLQAVLQQGVIDDLRREGATVVYERKQCQLRLDQNALSLAEALERARQSGEEHLQAVSRLREAADRIEEQDARLVELASDLGSARDEAGRLKADKEALRADIGQLQEQLTTARGVSERLAVDIASERSIALGEQERLKLELQRLGNPTLKEAVMRAIRAFSNAPAR